MERHVVDALAVDYYYLYLGCASVDTWILQNSPFVLLEVYFFFLFVVLWAVFWGIERIYFWATVISGGRRVSFLSDFFWFLVRFEAAGLAGLLFWIGGIEPWVCGYRARMSPGSLLTRRPRHCTHRSLPTSLMRRRPHKITLKEVLLLPRHHTTNPNNRDPQQYHDDCGRHTQLLWLIKAVWMLLWGSGVSTRARRVFLIEIILLVALFLLMPMRFLGIVCLRAVITAWPRTRPFLCFSAATIIPVSPRRFLGFVSRGRGSLGPWRSSTRPPLRKWHGIINSAPLRVPQYFICLVHPFDLLILPRSDSFTQRFFSSGIRGLPGLSARLPRIRVILESQSVKSLLYFGIGGIAANA